MWIHYSKWLLEGVVSVLQNLDVDKVNVGDLIVILALSITMFASVWFGMNELSMSIASGLLGYIGGTTKHVNHPHL